MAFELNRRLAAVKPSPTLAVTAKAAALKAEGKDVCSFGAGEPDFQTPAHICEAGKRAIDEGYTRYTPAPGMPALRKATSEHLTEMYGLDYRPSEVIITTGGKYGLFELFQSLLNEGDEVIITAPYWVSYPAQVLLSGGKPVIASASSEQGYKASAAQIAAAVTDRTKILVINSPSNPTGAVYSPDELRAIAQVAVDRDLFVISDEIYSRLLYDGTEFASVPTLIDGMRERTAVCSGWSKTYSMTGWRLGFVAAPEWLLKAMAKVQSQSTSNVTAMAQVAAIEALQGSHDFLGEWLVAFDRRRKFIVDALSSIDGVSCPTPKGAFYVFPDFSGVLDRKWNGEALGSSLRLADYLLTDHLVAVVPGEAFGAAGGARLSYATSDEVIEKGIERIKNALDQLD